MRLRRQPLGEPDDPVAEYRRALDRPSTWALFIAPPALAWQIAQLVAAPVWLRIAAFVLALAPAVGKASHLLRLRRRALDSIAQCAPEDLATLCDGLLAEGELSRTAVARLREITGGIRGEHTAGLSEERAKVLFGAMRWPDRKLCTELIRLCEETDDPAAIPALVDLAWIAEPGTALRSAAEKTCDHLIEAERRAAPMRSLLRPASGGEAAGQVLMRPAQAVGEPGEALLRPAQPADGD